MLFGRGKIDICPRSHLSVGLIYYSLETTNYYFFRENINSLIIIVIISPNLTSFYHIYKRSKLQSYTEMYNSCTKFHKNWEENGEDLPNKTIPNTITEARLLQAPTIALQLLILSLVSLSKLLIHWSNEVFVLRIWRIKC